MLNVVGSALLYSETSSLILFISDNAGVPYDELTEGRLNTIFKAHGATVIAWTLVILIHIIMVRKQASDRKTMLT